MVLRILFTAIALMGLPTSGLAAPVLWTLSGVTFSDGGTASGSFVYDAETDMDSAVNITTTTGPMVAGSTYLFVCVSPCDGAYSPTLLPVLTVPSTSPLSGQPLLELVFSSPLTDAGGTVAVTQTSFEDQCSDATCNSTQIPLRSVVAGSVVGVPQSPQSPIVYTVDLPGQLTGTITTDGTIGVLMPENIIAWNLTAYVPPPPAGPCPICLEAGTYTFQSAPGWSVECADRCAVASTSALTFQVPSGLTLGLTLGIFTPQSHYEISFDATGVVVSEGAELQMGKTGDVVTGPYVIGAPLQVPSAIVFPAQPVNTQSAPMPVTITNNGGASVTISSITGTDATEFPDTTTCVTTIAPGGTCTITISFRPAAAGMLSEMVTVTSNTTGSPQSFTVSGTGSTQSPSPDLNQHGLTGSYYQPATSGQGLEIEIFPNSLTGTGSTFVSWFTFDTVAGGEGAQRWYTAQGPAVTGQPNASLTIYQNTGGNFNALPATTAQAVGTATLNFSTCLSGQFSYSFSDGTGRTGDIALSRLTQNVTCSTTTPYATNADFALSGNWFDSAIRGQGFTIEVNPISSSLFVAWYTYEPSGVGAGAAGQRWYTAQAGFAAGMRSIPVTIYETTGGIFNMSAPAGQQTVVVGMGTLAFQSCEAATFSYTFTGGSSSGLSGTINLSRVGPVPPGCAS